MSAECHFIIKASPRSPGARSHGSPRTARHYTSSTLGVNDFHRAAGQVARRRGRQGRRRASMIGVSTARWLYARGESLVPRDETGGPAGEREAEWFTQC